MRIACLHTAASNVGVFARAARSLGLDEGVLTHRVRPDLLRAAEYTGGLTSEIEREAATVLVALARDADAVLLTCSTLGAAATRAASAALTPVLRADAALAAEAMRRGGRVTVLCAVETTLEPTSRLFTAAAKRAGTSVTVRLVRESWRHFREGDHAAYHAAIAHAADAAYAEGADLVALAQASMSGAAALARRGPTPLTSPAVGLAAALAAAQPLARGA
jgi:ATP-dependent helicase YprA (DUF1998 family)